MKNKKLLMICRVCGYKFPNFFPWGEDGETPSFSYCPCCFTEFGFDDVQKESIKIQRGKWVDSNYKWQEPDKKPENWNPEEQLKNVPDEFK